MPTMVEYTDSTPALNEYPMRIVSPTRPSPCCVHYMTPVGEETPEGRVIFRYKRCPHCGFTVRLILRELPDTELVETLRRELAVAFTRLDGVA